MINLLPPEIKSNYRYARRNLALRGWVIALAIATLGVFGLGTYGLVGMQQSIISYQGKVDAVQATLQKEKLTQTEKQVKDISTHLRLAVQVLSKEVLFSKLITQIGAAMPSGAVLSGLNINSTASGIDLTANALNYQTATQVQVNLSNPNNKIFTKADIVNIDCDSKQGGDYPCTVTLRALFGANNQYLFINQGGKS